MRNDIPLISQLLRALIVENYDDAIEIVKSDEFDPNETNESWKAPVITAIVSVISTTDKFKDKERLKEILKEIVSNKKFDPNFTDAEGETVLMHIARHSSFNWLVPFIMKSDNVDMSIKNFMNRDVIDIAENAGNTVLVDILLPLKAANIYKRLPKKRKDIKNKVTKTKVYSIGNINVLERIENAFNEISKVKPVSLYNLLAAFFRGDYTNCIRIVRDVNFDPNERDRWDEPVLSSLMYYSQDSNVNYDESMFRKITEIITSNKRFDVNAIDADCNTVLMVAMGFPKLKWLTEMLFNIQSANIDAKNDSGETLRDIAENCGNGDFYNHLVMKSFEAVEIVD